MEDLSKVKVDSQQGSLTYLGVEWVLLKVEALQGMFDETYRAFGSGALTIWYLAGKGAGRAMVKLVRSLERLGSREVAERICRELSRMGWGRFEIAEWAEETENFVFRVYNNPFSRRGAEAPEETGCIYIKGYLEGILEELLGRPVKLKETLCVSKGASYCEFTSKPPAETSIKA